MRIALSLAVLALSPALYGSKEGVLSLNTLHVESRGLGSSGPVVIDGTQSDEGMQSLQVSAFGKQFVLSASLLKKLGGSGTYNLLQISYEGGYAELGGRTIYIKLAQSSTFGEEHHKYVVLKENGNVRVDDRL